MGEKGNVLRDVGDGLPGRAGVKGSDLTSAPYLKAEDGTPPDLKSAGPASDLKAGPPAPADLASAKEASIGDLPSAPEGDGPAGPPPGAGPVVGGVLRRRDPEDRSGPVAPPA